MAAALPDHPDVLRLGASRAARVAAVVVGLAAAVMTVVAIVSAGFGAALGLFFFALMAAVALATLRVGVVASPDGLAINGGIRSRYLAWNDVEGFWYRPTRHSGGIFVLTSGHGMVHIPYAES